MEAVHQVGNRKRGGESIGLLKYQAPFGSNPRHAYRHCHTLTSWIFLGNRFD